MNQCSTLTSLGYGYHFRDIRHEYPALKLQLCVLVARLGNCRPSLILLILALPGDDLLATQEDALEEIYLVLEERGVSGFSEVNVGHPGDLRPSLGHPCQ